MNRTANTPQDLTGLTKDLRAAQSAAEVAITGVPDGGTCCLDHPVILLPLTDAVKEAIKAAGLRPGNGYGFWKGFTALRGFPGERFQGTPRTLGADTMAKVLADLGWTTGVHYQMD